MRKLVTLLVCLCASFLALADIQTPAVQAVGEAGSYRAAVNEALVPN